MLFFGSLALSQAFQGAKPVFKTSNPKAATCAPPTTTSFMEINNVRAMIHTAGNLWQRPKENLSMYEVPKNSGIMALFTAALWLGGTDVNNQLKLAALRYRNGQDYWTGPLSQVYAETSYEECDKYDKHFISTRDEIRTFNAWYETGLSDQQNGSNLQTQLFPNYQVPEIIKTWPAHGNTALGQDYYLAPFYDFNNDGTYHWEDGDYPWYDIKQEKECKIDRDVSLYGDKNFWWVMNDKGNIHTETGADPIGMEIRAQAFAFAANDEVNNMTFYNYVLINRGTQTLYNTYFGFFTDGALGDPFDDYVGCDVMRGLGYYYNGDNFDGDNAGFKGYGYSPPAVGVDFFEGPYQDDDGIDNAFGIGQNEALNGIGYGDGIIDNERYGMRRFLYYSNTTNGANVNQTDPIAAADYYNYLRGFWKDGTKFVYGGSGHISDPQADPLTPCDFMFPGTSDIYGWGTSGVVKPNWTEQTANNTPNDRRFVQSAGPFVLKPGAVNNITVGVAWARSNGGDPFQSVETLRRADDKAQALFENCFKVMDAPHAPDLTVQELSNELILFLSNAPNSNNYQEGYQEVDPFIVPPSPNDDKTYRFQGYQIYQLKNNTVALSDLTNPTKARLVAQCDVQDGVARIINFEFDQTLGFAVPKEKVNGENKGIRHSFQITQDAFAQGQSRLINFKKYYYLAISYAFNNYMDYNPNDPLLLDGQKIPYLASRKGPAGEVKIVEAIPHNPMPEADGTFQMIGYGSTPRITRLDGYGNGNRSLEFTDATLNTVLNDGFMEAPEYEYGQGPVNIKVVDPLNLKGGYFECRFRDYTATSPGNAADTASWVIYRYDTKGGTIQDSVSSDRAINGDNEQIIPAWGISVQIYQTKYYFPSGSGNISAKTTDMIESSITFADSSKRWLEGIPDNDAYFPTNWIRSGDYTPQSNECLPNGPVYLNPCNYPDDVGADPSQKYEGILGGTIAPHRLTGYQADYMPLAYFGTFNGSSRTNASISFLPSVNIVITSDKSKWTRCPVIELGRTSALNVGGAAPGAMRKSPSVDKEGNPDGTGTGMGWFPGYAVDLESGARLYMAFGENSFLGGENGADMVWNPTDKLVSNVGTPLMGGMHPIYVYSYHQKSMNGFNSNYDFPAYIPSQAENNATNEVYQKYLAVETNSAQDKRDLYGSLSWIAYPLLTQGQKLLSTDVTIKLRLNKEYKDFVATGANGGKPMYGWSMDAIATKLGAQDALKDALKMINVVPNPYYAYSDYERTRIESKVKITNLPDKCTVRIYSVNGKLIRTFKKDSPVTSLDWDLTNYKAIPVAGGVYLIHVDVPGVGEVVLKFFGGMRTPDYQGI
ncbi:MAG: T9SS C-terminal target domain-containing protein [Flavobacteriia bacterium]|nr:T9SS C-terminal target domain-containing protein [Flavobacteriia bacterium]